MTNATKTIGISLTLLVLGCGSRTEQAQPNVPVQTPAAQQQDGAALVKAAHNGKQEGLKIDTGEPVEKAAGEMGRTIADLFAEKAQLAGKQVFVRGKVTKFNPGIMGRNWLHIQDGSGSEGKNDFEVTVTSQDSAAVGETVLVQGKLSVDRDFGAGYVYAVIIEDAAIKK